MTASIAMMNAYAPLLLRIGLVALFPFSALDKVVNWQSALQQARGGILPGAPVLIVLGALIEVITPICIVAGWHDRLAALVLAGFCVVTALLYHPFWTFPAFWRFKEGPALAHFWDFLKNLGIAAGLGWIILGAQTGPVSGFAAHPLSSTEVMGPRAGATR
jgi:putative oxidoreductase